MSLKKGDVLEAESMRQRARKLSSIYVSVHVREVVDGAYFSEAASSQCSTPSPLTDMVEVFVSCEVHGVENLSLSLAAIYKHPPTLIVTEHNLHQQDNVGPPLSSSSADPPAYATTLALPQDGDAYAPRKLGNWLTVMAEKID